METRKDLGHRASFKGDSQVALSIRKGWGCWFQHFGDSGFSAALRTEQLVRAIPTTSYGYTSQHVPKH